MSVTPGGLDWIVRRQTALGTVQVMGFVTMVLVAATMAGPEPIAPVRPALASALAMVFAMEILVPASACVNGWGQTAQLLGTTKIRTVLPDVLTSASNIAVGSSSKVFRKGVLAI